MNSRLLEVQTLKIYWIWIVLLLLPHFKSSSGRLALPFSKARLPLPKQNPASICSGNFGYEVRGDRFPTSFLECHALLEIQLFFSCPPYSRDRFWNKLLCAGCLGACYSKRCIVLLQHKLSNYQNEPFREILWWFASVDRRYSVHKRFYYQTRSKLWTLPLVQISCFSSVGLNFCPGVFIFWTIPIVKVSVF